MALWCSIFGLLAWWFIISWMLLLGTPWSSSWDGTIWLMTVSSFVAMASTLGEANLFRWPLLRRTWKVALSGSVALVLSMLLISIWYGLASMFIEKQALFEDPHVVLFRYQCGAFVAAGLSASTGVLICRKWAGRLHLLNHLLGGVVAGLGAVCMAHVFHLFLPVISQAFVFDLYLSGAVASLSFGFLFGFCTWAIPDSLYAGWLRVLSHDRFGSRVPIDAKEGQAKERFIGNYPNGLDLNLPENSGVMELHISVFVDENQKYFLRGLSQQKTIVNRFLERLRLDYDERKPAPYEAKVSSGDRISMGQGAEVEFLMLPREEK